MKGLHPSDHVSTVAEVVRVPLPTPWGVFDVRAFEAPSGHVYLVLVFGEVEGKAQVLVRVHSECLTGDTLGSLRCDCGVQLRVALRAIAAEGAGVLVYVTGHEARGVGLVNKLRAYVKQDEGFDTLEANVELGLPVDARTYNDAAAVLAGLRLRSVRLLTNNPEKVRGLRDGGIDIARIEALPTAPHARNLHYLRTKERLLGHLQPTGAAMVDGQEPPAGVVDVTRLLGDVRPRSDRPYLVLKFAQTIDGRIATSTGDAKWISGEAERRVSHALRAACDAVLVGVGTVIRDDPQLTVRMVDGISPQRVVLDSALRLPDDAKLLAPEAPTTIVTTARSSSRRREELTARGVHVDVVEPAARGVDLAHAFSTLRRRGVQSLLVEGGSEVITSILEAGLADRLIVAVAPTIIGRGIDAVGGLGITSVADGVHLVDRVLHVADDDVLLAWNVAR